MSSHSRVRAPALWTSAGLVVLAIVVVLTAVWVAYDDGPAAAPVVDEPPAPEPDPEPEPEPEPEIEPEVEPEREPVHGAMEIVEVVDLSRTGAGVFQPGSAEDAAVPPDDAAIDALASAVTDWLDSYIATVPAGTWALDTDPASTSTAATQAGPHVQSATYQLRIGAFGAPEWVEARVTLHTDEATLAAIFTFADSGTPADGQDRDGQDVDESGLSAGVGDDGEGSTTANLPVPTLVAIEPASVDARAEPDS